jgi:uncharacterized SAM-binding protein YcdF (DUF218 family)
MTDRALSRGLDHGRLVTALPQPRGHTTRLLAEWLARSPYAGEDVMIVTHALHAARSRRIFARLGIRAIPVSLDLRFDPADPDWKLRSARIFRFYNGLAWVYCFARRWV